MESSSTAATMTTTTHELWERGRKIMGSDFVGVFPLDKLPQLSTLTAGKALIVNTDSSNLPGRHWIAVYVKPHVLEVFDPFGAIAYPHLLIARLHMDPRRRVAYNRMGIQEPTSKACGQHCLRWIESVSVYVCVCMCLFSSLMPFFFTI